MYWWHPYPRMLDQMFHLHAMPKVLGSLAELPQTIGELSKSLELPKGLIRFTIGQLWRAGHVLENRGSWCGKPSRRGRYHLIKKPGVDYGDGK